MTWSRGGPSRDRSRVPGAKACGPLREVGDNVTVLTHIKPIRRYGEGDGERQSRLWPAEPTARRKRDPTEQGSWTDLARRLRFSLRHRRLGSLCNDDPGLSQQSGRIFDDSILLKDWNSTCFKPASRRSPVRQQDRALWRNSRSGPVAAAGHQHELRLLICWRNRGATFARAANGSLVDLAAWVWCSAAAFLELALCMRTRELCHKGGGWHDRRGMIRAMAARPSDMAECVFPTSSGPGNSRLSPLPVRRKTASSRICLRLVDGCALHTKPSSARISGNLAIDIPISMRRSLAREFGCAQQGPRLAQALCGETGLPEHRVKLVTDGGQLQAGEHQLGLA